MDTIIGIKGKDFVLVGADCYAEFRIIRLSDDIDKIYEVDDNKLLATSGDYASQLMFGEYIQRNIHLTRLRNYGVSMSPRAAAHFTRNELATALRKSPVQVDALLGGYNKETKQAELFWLDQLGTMCETNKSAHGHGSRFVFGLLDKEYHPDITRDEAFELMKKCFEEVKRRFIAGKSKFILKEISPAGFKVTQVTI